LNVQNTGDKKSTVCARKQNRVKILYNASCAVIKKKLKKQLTSNSLPMFMLFDFDFR